MRVAGEPGTGPGRAPSSRKCWGGRHFSGASDAHTASALVPSASSGARRAAGPFVLVGYAFESRKCWRPQHTPRGLQCSWIPAFAGMTVGVLTGHPRLASPPRRRGPTRVDPCIGAHRCSEARFHVRRSRALFASRLAKASDRRAPRGALVRGLEGVCGRATIRLTSSAWASPARGRRRSRGRSAIGPRRSSSSASSGSDAKGAGKSRR